MKMMAVIVILTAAWFGVARADLLFTGTDEDTLVSFPDGNRIAASSASFNDDGYAVAAWLEKDEAVNCMIPHIGVLSSITEDGRSEWTSQLCDYPLAVDGGVWNDNIGYGISFVLEPADGNEMGNARQTDAWLAWTRCSDSQGHREIWFAHLRIGQTSAAIKNSFRLSTPVSPGLEIDAVDPEIAVRQIPGSDQYEVAVAWREKNPGTDQKYCIYLQRVMSGQVPANQPKMIQWPAGTFGNCVDAAMGFANDTLWISGIYYFFGQDRVFVSQIPSTQNSWIRLDPPGNQYDGNCLGVAMTAMYDANTGQVPAIHYLSKHFSVVGNNEDTVNFQSSFARWDGSAWINKQAQLIHFTTNVEMREPGIVTIGDDVYLSWAGTPDKFGKHEIYVGYSDSAGQEFASGVLASYIEGSGNSYPMDTCMIMDVQGRATVLWMEKVSTSFGLRYEQLVSHVIGR